MPDFRLQDYVSIIETAADCGYRMMSVDDLFRAPEPDQRHIVLRHDVDRKPGNALEMAKEEEKRGVRSTYFFRIVPAAYDTHIIREIADLGHEIGYHYEDFYIARYDADAAFALYEKHLADLRTIAQVKTIAMHGSPLAKFNNMELWRHKSFEPSGVSDCILSFDWSDYQFFTDTGRSFGATRTNLRDSIGGQSVHSVRNSVELMAHLRKATPEKIQLSTHPERWAISATDWTTQLAADTAVNLIKLGMSVVRLR